MSNRSSIKSISSTTSGISMNSSDRTLKSSTSLMNDTNTIYTICQSQQININNIKRHQNLDTKELSFKENVHLARLHYLRKQNLLRLIFIGCCIPFFIITSHKVWIEYVTHKTVVNMEFTVPTLINLPSVTLCIRLISNNHDTKSKFFLDKNLNVHRHYRNGSSSIYSLSLHDVIEDCKIYSNTIIMVNETMPIYDCEFIAPVITSFQYGHKCFTYFSDIHGDISRAPKDQQPILEFDLFPSIHFILSSKFSKSENGSRFSFVLDHYQTNRSNASLLFIMIHETNNLPAILDDSVRFVLPNNRMIVLFGEKNEILKPYPFDTNCFESYNPMLPDHEINRNGDQSDYPNGFRSSGECLVHCLSEKLNIGCTNYYSVITEKWIHNHLQNPTNLLPFCKSNQTRPYFERLDQCMQLCPSPCIRQWFTMAKVSSEPYNQTSIRLYRLNEPTHWIQHVEATSLETFLGNIGGHLHVWLGISVIEIFNYIISIIRSRPITGIFCCIFLLIKRRRNDSDNDDNINETNNTDDDNDIDEIANNNNGNNANDGRNGNDNNDS